VRHVNSYRTHKLTRSIRTAHTSAKARLFVVLPVPPYHNRFTALFPGPPGWAGARTELLDFMVQGKINRGRHTDHPAGRHSIRTNQCPPPPSRHINLWKLLRYYISTQRRASLLLYLSYWL